MKAEIAAIPESYDAEVYLPPFQRFAAALFDTEAEATIEKFETQDPYESFMRDKLVLSIIEGILPDRGLETVKRKWLPEVAALSTEKEIGSEILLECRADGTKAPAREEILAADAPHGDFENFAPPAVSWSLRFEKNAKIRESLRQVLERRSAYWLDHSLSLPWKAGRATIAAVAEGIRPGEPLSENVAEDDPRHSTLVPFFELMEKFRVLSEEYSTLSLDWLAEDAKWISWPPPARAVREGENCPTAPGSDAHVVATADEAARRLLGEPESWFNPGRDAWLEVKGKDPWEHWFYAIREFWLNAAEEAEEAGVDTDEFEKTAAALGYLHTHGPEAVGERVWRRMIKSKKSLRNSLQELGLSAGDTIERYEEPAGRVQRGSIKQVFSACAYFCGVLAAQRARQLQIPRAAGPEAAPTYIIGTHAQPSTQDWQVQLDQLGSFAIEMMGALRSRFQDPTAATQALIKLLWKDSPYILHGNGNPQSPKKRHRIDNLRQALLHEIDKLVKIARGANDERRVRRLKDLEGDCTKLPEGLYAIGPITAVDTEQQPDPEERIRVQSALKQERPAVPPPVPESFLLSHTGERRPWPEEARTLPTNQVISAPIIPSGETWPTAEVSESLTVGSKAMDAFVAKWAHELREAGDNKGPKVAPRAKGDSNSQTRARKGDLKLVQDSNGGPKESVSFDHAGLYLGITRRQIQRLVSQKKALTVIGGGQNKRITVKSLLIYLPAEKAT